MKTPRSRNRCKANATKAKREIKFINASTWKGQGEEKIWFEQEIQNQAVEKILSLRTLEHTLEFPSLDVTWSTNYDVARQAGMLPTMQTKCIVRNNRRFPIYSEQQI